MSELDKLKERAQTLEWAIEALNGRIRLRAVTATFCRDDRQASYEQIAEEAAAAARHCAELESVLEKIKALEAEE